MNVVGCSSSLPNADAGPRRSKTIQSPTNGGKMSVNGKRNHYRSFYGFDIQLNVTRNSLSIIRAKNDEGQYFLVIQCNYKFSTDST